MPKIPKGDVYRPYLGRDLVAPLRRFSGRVGLDPLEVVEFAVRSLLRQKKVDAILQEMDIDPVEPSGKHVAEVLNPLIRPQAEKEKATS